MQFAVKWKEMTVRALPLGKVAPFVDTNHDSSQGEILLGDEQSWIRAGICVETDTGLGKWKQVLSNVYSNDSEWIQTNKNTNFPRLAVQRL